MSQWSLIYENFEPAQEKRREALCTLGNGYSPLAALRPKRMQTTCTIPARISRAATTGL